MPNIKKFLAKWIVDYYKNKDIMLGDIVSIDENKDGFDAIINEQDKKILCIALDQPEKFNFNLNKEGFYVIVMLNRKESLDFLLNNWEKLVEFPNFKIFFINPFSDTDKKWIISPYIHNKVCDEKALKTGLRSMFETVEPIIDRNLKNLG